MTRMYEASFKVARPRESINLIEYFRNITASHIPAGNIPVRFVVTKSDDRFHWCDVGVLEYSDPTKTIPKASIFDFRQRKLQRADEFNAVFLLPTGIGAEIGGHAGDATPVARLLAEACDNLIIHPNVVNASDINEAPENAIYVEGSVITKLLMGTCGLQNTRSNRVLTIVDGEHSSRFINATINTVNAARATYSLDCEKIVLLDPSMRMTAIYLNSGRAAGEIERLDTLFATLDDNVMNFDAVALTSIIDVPEGYHQKYFESEGNMVNPWGGVEAMLTHAVTFLYGVPTAHAPMMESDEVANMDTGVVDPRIAAESISMSFLNCVLKGLQQSPAIVDDVGDFGKYGIRSVEDVSCIVIPDGCLGLPTLAALIQGISVIAVQDNTNLMANDLTQLPWKEGQFRKAGSYLEAVGMMLAMKAGLTLGSLTRPLARSEVETGRSGKEDVCLQTDRLVSAEG